MALTKGMTVTSTAKDIRLAANLDLSPGSWYYIQNRGDETIYLAESATAPTAVTSEDLIELAADGALEIFPTEMPFWAIVETSDTILSRHEIGARF